MISHKELCNLLSYDPLTGVFKWRVDRARTKAGATAGTIFKSGYLVVKVKGKQYLAHRLAWFFTYGVWPKQHIDHEDGNKLNNSLLNLREATPTQNQGNYGPQLRNTTGFKGVSLVKRLKSRPWQASIGIKGKVKYLGMYATPEAAHAAYTTAAINYFGEFACVSSN